MMLGGPQVPGICIGRGVSLVRSFWNSWTPWGHWAGKPLVEREGNSPQSQATSLFPQSHQIRTAPLPHSENLRTDRKTSQKKFFGAVSSATCFPLSLFAWTHFRAKLPGSLSKGPSDLEPHHLVLVDTSTQGGVCSHPPWAFSVPKPPSFQLHVAFCGLPVKPAFPSLFSSPPKPTVFISGVIARGDKDFPPAAAQVAHQKPHASIDKHPSPRTQHIQQPRK
ncbi:hypothetical protein GHT09_006601 [Marmota monax]|uniref:Uncharacterized protein n=1 Tax=Marmota monax TaxID=9995 RepID=A0A834V3F8_MARMO|nr:hypothetical protein GHT09_006601 [Marmota monax]